MAEKSTLEMIDELDKITQDFLSELNVMESKRGGPSDMESKRGGPSDTESKRGGPSDMESKRGGPSNMESTKGGPSDTLSKRRSPSDMESERGGFSDMESKRCCSSDVKSKKGGPSDMEKKESGPSDMESKRVGLSDRQSERADPSDIESKRGGPSNMENKTGGPSKQEIVTGEIDKIDSASDGGALLSDGPSDAEEYCMKHPRRGQCLIFVNKSFLKLEFGARSSATEDSQVCGEAFKALNFEVEVFQNLTTNDLRAELEKASKRDHSDCDALAVVFMSHGQSKDGREELVTYDGSIPTAELWRSISQCRSLQGKPKLFFIQACRGKVFDSSVGLKVSTDGPSLPEPLAEWALGFNCPDMLVMQSSYQGMYSFRISTEREGMKGSVFIHFLAKILKDKGRQKDLSEMLLEVTRRVALDYEAQGGTYAKAKQMPVTRSTLTKKITLVEA